MRHHYDAVVYTACIVWGFALGLLVIGLIFA